MSASPDFIAQCAKIQNAHRALFATRKTASLQWREEQLEAVIRMCEEKKGEIEEALTEDLG